MIQIFIRVAPDSCVVGGRDRLLPAGAPAGQAREKPPLFLVGVLGSLALRGQEGDLYFLEPGAPFIQGFPRTLLAPGRVCVCWGSVG